jgi:hypothetical protein
MPFIKGHSSYLTKESRKKISEAMKGRHFSKEHKRKISESHANEKHPRWKSNDASYATKHQWIQRHYGKATKCSICSIEGNGHQVHWANKDHKYRRKKEDYFQACAKCHGEYDKFNKLRKRKEVMKY